MMANFPFFVFVGMLVLTYLQIIIDAQVIGVCYGMNGNDLPSPIDVVALYKANNITKMRTYDPITETLPALKGSEIEVILDIPNSKLQSLGDPQEADNWVTTNVMSYAKEVKIRYINVGNEISPVNNGTSQFVPFLLPALTNVQQSITKSGLQDQVKVSTAIETGLLANTYPPSQSAFREDTMSFIKPIIEFLKQNNAPLQANIYPYFGYIGDPEHVQLPYALFTQEQPDPSGYPNLFDAMLDSIYYAIDKAIGENNVEIVVSESGWPSDGGVGASVENAATYYKNLMDHAKSTKGTIYRPGKTIETYLFAMFDENLKIGAETEKHFGVFHPDKTQKYNLSF
ncbi:glucan endo-1,3-beta-glucosidase, acidic-like [Solanum verrucosum]|uniref:glucan endo-1,3-beta-glucosidase, acidic-like n=1 Tax=Solanum verrucosum TaxID=315347 RepID=UPI0020D059CC|nr:glucan endo-1,3-beta-glucosidase, acidic-like [Solanum verrucosum]